MRVREEATLTPHVLHVILPGLGLDKYRNLHIEQWKKERAEMVMDEGSVFTRLGHNGLISFSDYLFLLTIISSEECVCACACVHHREK